ncbi:MAG: hypothetical protein KF782_04895 [Labilithrix sp.]|nr:hypothetical protein [Labilithrix sp.]
MRCRRGRRHPCVGFCQNVVTTCGASPTRITGKIYAPNNTLPIPGAVYTSNGSMTAPYGVTAITDGVAGGTVRTVQRRASGSPLTTTTSAADGVPSQRRTSPPAWRSARHQLGKWRRIW